MTDGEDAVRENHSSYRKAGIVCCSNGQKKEYAKKLKDLENTLRELGFYPVSGSCIYEKEGVYSGTAKERASALMDFFRDDETEHIFDISGGDLANGILPYLDYGAIAGSTAVFWGYSDLTAVINAVYAKTGKASVLYQIRNLVSGCRKQQTADFRNSLLYQKKDLFRIRYHFIRKNEMQGVILGGNIRCFLKLAGTEYMPDLTGKILLLESLSGTVPRMETYLCQLQQMGAFEKAAGILLGTFTQMEAEKCEPPIEELVLRFAGEDLPVAVTGDIGHGTDAKAVIIGQKCCFSGSKMHYEVLRESFEGWHENENTYEPFIDAV